MIQWSEWEPLVQITIQRKWTLSSAIYSNSSWESKEDRRQSEDLTGDFVLSAIQRLKDVLETVRGEQELRSSFPSLWAVLNQSSRIWASTHFCRNPIATPFSTFLSSALLTLFYHAFCFLVTVLIEPKGTRMRAETVGRAPCLWSFLAIGRLTSFFSLSFTLNIVECIR